MDSGRGKSRTPSTTPAKELVAEAYADAVKDIEARSSMPEVAVHYLNKQGGEERGWGWTMGRRQETEKRTRKG